MQNETPMAALPAALSIVQRERETRCGSPAVDEARGKGGKLRVMKDSPLLPPVSLSKREFARRHSSSERTVDNWVAAGCPTIRYSRRKVLFPVDLADAWLREKFLVARRKPSTAKLRVANVPAVTTAESEVGV